MASVNHSMDPALKDNQLIAQQPILYIPEQGILTITMHTKQFVSVQSCIY